MDTQPKKFLYVESHQIPLTEIPYGDLKENMLDPTTGQLYKGIVMEGCFADLSNETPNNNKRYYDIPTYLQLLQVLRKQIFSPKGVFGELEHPESSYAIDSRNVSHKLLDVWYNEVDMKVYGRVILLNTPNGIIAQEIVRSGGQLAISARAAGDETLQPDGTKLCRVKLMTTYDLVYHPGFSAAVLTFKQLNESQKFIQDISETKRGFSGIIYEEDLKKINNKFEHYISLNERQNCFYEWLLNDLSEAEKISKEDKKNIAKKEKIENKQDIEVLDDNKANDEEELQNKLKMAAKKDLKESQKKEFFQQVQNSQELLRKKNQGKSYYQGAAGFIADNYSISING